MRALNMQQLCSFAQDNRKIDEKFILFNVNDISLFEKFRVAGCRLNLLLFSGNIEAEINGKTVSLQRCDFVDILEGMTLGFKSFSNDLL